MQRLHDQNQCRPAGRVEYGIHVIVFEVRTQNMR